MRGADREGLPKGGQKIPTPPPPQQEQKRLSSGDGGGGGRSKDGREGTGIEEEGGSRRRLTFEKEEEEVDAATATATAAAAAESLEWMKLSSVSYVLRKTLGVRSFVASGVFAWGGEGVGGRRWPWGKWGGWGQETLGSDEVGWFRGLGAGIWGWDWG